MNEVVAKLSAIAENGYEERIYVRGDREADYGNVMRVMGLISQAGYKRLAMVTLQEQGDQ
jgi:biopolymer transport protein TolR